MEDNAYLPFGEKWKKEVMKMSKVELVEFLRINCLERQEYQEALRDRQKQLNELLDV